MFFVFLNCYGLVKVNDKEGFCIIDGKFFILEGIGNYGFFCVVILVLILDFRIMIFFWNYVFINKVCSFRFLVSV